jgi:hypothetical protein
MNERLHVLHWNSLSFGTVSGIAEEFSAVSIVLLCLQSVRLGLVEMSGQDVEENLGKREIWGGVERLWRNRKRPCDLV